MYDTLTLNTEATVEVTGTLQVVPEGKTVLGGHKLNADYWHVLGTSPGGSDVFTNQVNEVLYSLILGLTVLRQQHCFLFRK